MDTNKLKIRIHPENVGRSATGDVYIAIRSPLGSCTGCALSRAGRTETSLCLEDAEEKQVQSQCIAAHRRDRRNVIFHKL